MNNDVIGPLCAILVIVVFICGIFMSGHAVGRQKVEMQAIAAGVAKFTVNETNGFTKFVFITNNIPAK